MSGVSLKRPFSTSPDLLTCMHSGRPRQSHGRLWNPLHSRRVQWTWRNNSGEGISLVMEVRAGWRHKPPFLSTSNSRCKSFGERKDLTTWSEIITWAVSGCLEYLKFECAMTTWQACGPRKCHWVFVVVWFCRWSEWSWDVFSLSRKKVNSWHFRVFFSVWEEKGIWYNVLCSVSVWVCVLCFCHAWYVCIRKQASLF